MIRVMKWTTDIDHTSTVPQTKGVKMRMAINPHSIVWSQSLG